MKVFCVRTQGFKTVVEFPTKEEFERFINSLSEGLERLWVEVKEAKP